MGMWRRIGTIVGIGLLVTLVMGLSVWWWSDTSAGTWAWAPVRWVVRMAWGVAPILAWAVTLFVVMGVCFDREGRPRWG